MELKQEDNYLAQLDKLYFVRRIGLEEKNRLYKDFKENGTMAEKVKAVPLKKELTEMSTNELLIEQIKKADKVAKNVQLLAWVLGIIPLIALGLYIGYLFFQQS